MFRPKEESLSQKLLISKREIDIALANSRWFNPYTWDDKPLSLLRAFMQDRLANERNDKTQINIKRFLKYARDHHGESDLLGKGYFENQSSGYSLFSNWMNSPIRELPIELWQLILSFVSKQELVRASRVCRDFYRFTNEPALMQQAAWQARDYSQEPKRINLQISASVYAISPMGYFACTHSPDNFILDQNIYIVDIKTAKIIDTLKPNFDDGEIVSLRCGAEGEVIAISAAEQCVLFKRVNHRFIKEKQADAIPLEQETYVDLPERKSLKFDSSQRFATDCEISDANSKTLVRLVKEPEQNEDNQYLFSVTALPNGNLLYGTCLIQGSGAYNHNLWMAEFPEKRSFDPSLEAIENTDSRTSPCNTRYRQ